MLDGDDNAAQHLANSSTLGQTHAVSDPIFAPVRKLPTEILAKIFIECIPSLVLEDPPSFDKGMHPQEVRARLGQVCRLWNAILSDEPGVWATLVLDNPLPALEIVSLWIKRSKSHPLDVYFQNNVLCAYGEAGNAIVKMLHRELWRIRSFFTDFIDYYDISPIFPPDLLTEAPIMRSLWLKRSEPFLGGHLGYIHCPQLHTLTLQNCDKAVESLISKPMQNLRVLTITDHRGDNMLYIKLLQALPNLVSLTWRDIQLSFNDEIPRVVLRSLKSLTLRRGPWDGVTCFLACLYVPSLEHLQLEDFRIFNVYQGSLNSVLNVICGDRVVQLCCLTLGDGALKGPNFYGIWHHLKHLETLFIRGVDGDVPADGLFIALSPRNRDFSSLCPQLKTVELSYVTISPGVLVDFVRRRVKSDLGGPGPGLVTCLKLLNVWVDKKVSAQFAKTRSLSVHLETHHVLRHWLML